MRQTGLRPWATTVLPNISTLSMTGREKDYCENMCHATMETGQMNGTQKDLKRSLLIQEREFHLNHLLHKWLVGEKTGVAGGS